jgi:hypothetical protein
MIESGLAEYIIRVFLIYALVYDFKVLSGEYFGEALLRESIDNIFMCILFD